MSMFQDTISRCWQVAEEIRDNKTKVADALKMFKLGEPTYYKWRKTLTEAEKEELNIIDRGPLVDLQENETSLYARSAKELENGN